MRTVTYGGACSLDGYLTAADGAMDWLHFSRDVQDVMTAYWATVDAVLMGRRTWEVAAASGGGGASDGRVRTYLFSRTLREAPPGVELVRDDAGGFVRALKRQPGGGICVMGGGDLARSLFEADVVDEVGLNVHPILLGGGTPAFHPMPARVKLELRENRTIAGGCALLTYRVVHRRDSRARAAGPG
jgi:dihydrofolate reductase